MSEVLNKQISELKKKGLIFRDEEFAKKMILRENYYSLTHRYTDIFLSLKKKNHQFDDETYFEELFSVYQFDRDLKNLFFASINILEENIKSYIAYSIVDMYGDGNFLNYDIFENNNERVNKLREQISINMDRDVDGRVHINDNISAFLLVKYFTFGNITNLYHLLKKDIREYIEKYTLIKSFDMDEYLRILNIVRNICAHGDVLFNIKIYTKLNKLDRRYKNHKLYSLVFILKELLSKIEFQHFIKRFENLLICLHEELDDISYYNLLSTIGYLEYDFDKVVYNPNPIDTQDVVLDSDIMMLSERLAENAHDLWAVRRMKEGWRYGTIRDDRDKTSPDLVPYSELDEEEKKYDRDVSQETLKVIQRLGFKIVKECE